MEANLLVILNSDLPQLNSSNKTARDLPTHLLRCILEEQNAFWDREGRCVFEHKLKHIRT